MMIVVLFTMAFVLGPALFLMLLRLDGQRWPLALVASVLVVLSFRAHSEASLTLTLAPLPVFLSILFIWLAWIIVLVMVTQAMRRTYPTRRAGRWARAFGAMGTTVPWFGFATAQMIAR